MALPEEDRNVDDSADSQPRQARVRALSRHPGVHFLLLGGLLFWGQGYLNTSAEVAIPERVLEVDTAQVAQLRQQWQLAHRRSPTADEQDQLVQQWVEEEILYREALAAGVDRADPSVCNRLALNMRFLGLTEDSVTVETADSEEATWPGLQPRKQTMAGARDALCQRARELGLGRDDPVIRRQMVTMMRLLLGREAEFEDASDQELEDYVARHPSRFLMAPRVELTQVFLSRSRGAALEEDARSLLDRLTGSSIDPRQASSLGDPQPVSLPGDGSSERDLKRRFGSNLARSVMELPTGRWSEPLPSALGLHVVWIHQRLPAERRPWPEIEEQVRLGLLAERKQMLYAQGLEQLRADWRVEIHHGGKA